MGTLLCWWISTFCPWAAKRTPAGLLRTTSRYRRREKGVGVSEYMASVLLGVLSKDSGGVESEMTLSLLSILFRGFHCYETVLISPPNHFSSCHSFLLWSPSPMFIIKSCSFSAAQPHVAVLTHLHTLYRRLQPWFEMLWTRGLSSTKSRSTTEDSPNRRGSSHQLQLCL